MFNLNSKIYKRIRLETEYILKENLTVREIAKKINMRITPEFIFVKDDTLEYGARIDSILNEIMKDIKE